MSGRVIQIGRQFSLPDVTIPFTLGKGKRYKREALRFKGKNTADILHIFDGNS